MEDYPLLANLLELKKQRKIKQARIRPDWVRKTIQHFLEIAKNQDPDALDWRQLVWSVYWFTKFSAYEVVALAVAKIQKKWHTGDSIEDFFTKLKQQEEIAIARAITQGWPAEAVNDPKWRLTKSQTGQGVGPRKSLMGPVEACPLDDRDTNLDSEDEKLGYGFPEEDFKKDCQQLAFLLGGSTTDRNLTWVGLAKSFVWPPESNSFTEVPMAQPRVSTTEYGVTITLTSAFAPLDWVANPLLQEQIKDAIRARFGFYEQIPSTWDMIDYLEGCLDVDDSPTLAARRKYEKLRTRPAGEDAKTPDTADPAGAHAARRYRAKLHPLFHI